VLFRSVLDSQVVSRARRKATFFQVFGGVSALLFVTLFASFLLTQRAALKAVLADTGSLLGLVIGAIIAIPITLLLSPSTKSELPSKVGSDD